MFRTLALIGLFACGAANAATFRFDAGNSELGFTGDYGGEAVPGVFRKFSGTAEFDLARPLATRFRTEIEVSSLDTDYAERDDTLRTPEFFDTAAHPQAVWVSTGGLQRRRRAAVVPGHADAERPDASGGAGYRAGGGRKVDRGQGDAGPQPVRHWQR
jgi:polyisoprenoid-binding protein YceI